jgi:hypothetical protein
VEANAAAFAGPELNRIRVDLSRRFSALDDFFSLRLRDALTQVAAVFRGACGDLFPPPGPTPADGPDAGAEDDPAQLLGTLSRLLREAPQPSPRLAEALDELLSVRLEYRTLLYPRVRADLGPLNLQVTGADGLPALQQVAVELTVQGAEDLYQIFCDLAEQAAFRVQKALAKESVTPTAVIHAVVEQFQDTLIRSGDSVTEFQRFVRCYRTDMWSEEFRGIDQANVRYARVVSSLHAISKALEEE